MHMSICVLYFTVLTLTKVVFLEGVFELISVQTGVVAIRAKKTGRYLAMDSGLVRNTNTINIFKNLVEFSIIRFTHDKTVFMYQIVLYPIENLHSTAMG